MIIARVSYFQLCHCEMHGWIVLPDGKTSNGFTTTVDGIAEVDRLHAKGKIAGDEVAFLKSSIATSPLPQKESPFFEMLKTVQGIKEEVEAIFRDHAATTKGGPPPVYH